MGYTVEDILAIHVGKFGMNLREARRSLPKDFPILLKSYDIASQEKEYYISLQAWQSQAVQATTGSGKNTKSKYRNFNDFYDNRARFNSALGRQEPEEENKLTLADRNRIINKNGRVEVRRKKRDIALMNRLMNNRRDSNGKEVDDVNGNI